MVKKHMKPTFLFVVISSFVAFATASAATEDENEECLSCHGNEDMTVSLENGKEAPLFMKADLLTASVHKKLRCVECHADNAQVPHPERKFKDLAAFRASFSDTCNKCHADNHAKMLDGVHSKIEGAAKANAPTCISCHGSHAVAKPAEPRTRIADTCATCHKEIVEQYAHSVHGQGVAQGDSDAPTCTDCHNPHDMADPKDRAWLMSSPEKCGGCHSDVKKMAKHGLSTSVMSTYVDDFHGTTASFGATKGKVAAGERRVALCSDCHGVHDIGRAPGANAAVLRANLIETCRKCHTGASNNFLSAWLGHQEASLTGAPAVFSIKLFYWFVIPSILGGLLLQIFLHFRRSMAKR